MGKANNDTFSKTTQRQRENILKQRVYIKEKVLTKEMR